MMNEQNGKLRERESEATSKETLEDVEENENTSGSQTDDDSGKFDVPSPDGPADAPRDQPDDAGPM